jgi:hypothetical protein
MGMSAIRNGWLCSRVSRASREGQGKSNKNEPGLRTCLYSTTENATGDDILTDGKVLVIQLKSGSFRCRRRPQRMNARRMPDRSLRDFPFKIDGRPARYAGWLKSSVKPLEPTSMSFADKNAWSNGVK